MNAICNMIVMLSMERRLGSGLLKICSDEGDQIFFDEPPKTDRNSLNVLENGNMILECASPEQEIALREIWSFHYPNMPGGVMNPLTRAALGSPANFQTNRRSRER